MSDDAERESMDFDVVIVGGGPAGLSAAGRLMQLAKENNQELSVAIVEKGSEIGAHILSGNVFDPKGIEELFPDYQKQGAPVKTAVTDDIIHYFISAAKSIKIPRPFIPNPMHNKGNYIVSLGRLCQWMGEQIEALGVNIFPGVAASEVLYDEQGRVRGIATSNMGVSKDGQQKPTFQAGYELLARYTIFAEGCRGNLGEKLIDKFDLRKDADPQRYGIGLKEIWEIDPSKHDQGLVMHTMGWPLRNDTEGGGFLYHAEGNQVFLGLIIALNYTNPHLVPFEELQRWKQHPKIRQYLEGGKRIAYGARAVNKGGQQSLPKLVFPGGMLVGCDAGFLNTVKIKGAHTAIKTGMLAAESVFEALADDDEGRSVLKAYEDGVSKSWVHTELYRARNFGPALHKFGTFFGAAFTFIDQNIFRGQLPFTLRDKYSDHDVLKKAHQAQKIYYPKPDGVISFDLLSSVFLSNTNHEEDQPSHLILKNPSIPVDYNLPEFDEPAQRYCPAGVYEITIENNNPRFQINAQNCVHCKTCDIKDPRQNIVWTVPEGGGGPNYSGM
jgi:electron-transferring-flavoprotein dehydrogenase